VIIDRTRQLIQDALKRQRDSTANGSETSGDKSCSEYSSGKRPASTTWPWSIKPSLAVLWGVCWMFAMVGMFPQLPPGWGNMNQQDIKAEEYARHGHTYGVGMTSGEYRSELTGSGANTTNIVSQPSTNATAQQSHHPLQGSGSGSVMSSANDQHLSWAGNLQPSSASNAIGARLAPGNSTQPQMRQGHPGHSQPITSLQPALPQQLPAAVSSRSAHADSLSPQGVPSFHHHHHSALQPHPSGQQISLSQHQPQAASLDIHHQLPVSQSTLPSASASANSGHIPSVAWPTNQIGEFPATVAASLPIRFQRRFSNVRQPWDLDQPGLGIKQSPSSPYRPYNAALHQQTHTRTPSVCSPASQPLFAAAGVSWNSHQQPAYGDPGTPSTPSYLGHSRSSFDAGIPNIQHPESFARHQHQQNVFSVSGSEHSYDLSSLSYPPSPATHNVQRHSHRMDSINADTVLTARTVEDLSNAAAAANEHPIDDSMDDTLDGFSSRRGHTHKRNEEPPRDDSGKMICRFQNSCGGITFERKCEWSKHMDKHERPYKCQASGCEKLQGFTYSGGLLRHQREVHKMHGGTKESLHCPFENCKRAGGPGFTRKENLQEHIRRVHRRNTDGAELLAGSKRDLETLEMTDPLLRSELGAELAVGDGEEIGDENIDPNVSMTGTPNNPNKRRRIHHVNGTTADIVMLDGSESTDVKSLIKRLQDQNSALSKANESLRRDVLTLTERMSKVEGYIGRRMLEESVSPSTVTHFTSMITD
jgi:hypothetical protein